MPRKKLIEFNRKNIIDAARQLFAEKGISKTTVDDIAILADCSKATIYVYYKNKNDIYYHIVLEYMIILHDNFKQCIEKNSDYEACYYEICNSFVAFEEKYPLYFECLLGNISVNQDDFTQFPVLQEIYKIGENINALVCSFLKDAQKNGFAAKSIEPLSATMVLWSGICGLITMWSNKRDYFENYLLWKKDSFLNNGFKMLLNTIRTEVSL